MLLSRSREGFKVICFVFVMAGLCSACSGPSSPNDSVDGGLDSGTDAGSAIDSGHAPDASVDAGLPVDSGTIFDAGLDAGQGVDAGTTSDAGFASDAGVDAGPQGDAGIDAGTPFDLQYLDGRANPSCAALSDTCGADAGRPCCASTRVEGGSFNRSNDSAAPAAVSTFRLDVYEVTVGRFRAFVDAGRGTVNTPPNPSEGAHPKIPNSGWSAAWNSRLSTSTAVLVANLKCDSSAQTWTDTPGANENKAIVCVTWYDALAFCAWDNAYLPTEAEWNYAATGGNEQRLYPWGNVIDDSRVVYGPTAATPAVGQKSPLGDGKWQHADLSGSAWEWTLDLYVNPYEVPCNDCSNISTGTQRMLRGGSYLNPELGLGSAYRNPGNPNERFKIFGFRCSRSP
jgi:formylglycine-generating enzyme